MTTTSSGGITGSGDVVLNATDSQGGTLLLQNANNTYSGTTTVNNLTTLKGGTAGAFSAGSATTVNTGGALDLGGFAQTITSLAGGGVVSTSANSPTTVTLTNQGSGTSTFSGRITDGFGTVALTQGGPGTLTLTGANTYSGGTTISGGTLQIGAGKM